MKQKTLLIIKKALTKLLKKENKADWITPDDIRFTNILTEYEEKLSAHWDKTRDKYLKKIKKDFGDFTEIDDTPEDYPDPQYDSSDYIDEALAILALAFGAGVIVGYEEIQNRDITVDIPENPHKLFDEAKEIYNYSHAALSSEQNDMNDIFAKYNNLDDAQSLIRDWFDNNKYRLTDLMLGGVVWYSIQFGFARAAIEATTGEEAGLELYWLTERDNNVCIDCKALEDGNPYTKKNPLPTLPGGGKTLCGSRCRCVIDIKDRE